MALVELKGDIVFAVGDGDTALLLMTDEKRAGLVLMTGGMLMRILLDDEEDVDMLIEGLRKLKKKLGEMKKGGE